MLYLHFNAVEETIWSPGKYFDIQFEREWLDNRLVREMILDIDKSIVRGGSDIDSPVLGPISPRELSGGVKALIMMLFEPEQIYNGSACGNNCAKWVLEIAKHHDITLTYGHVMRFPEPFEIVVMNSGKVVASMLELVEESIDFLPTGAIW